MSFWKNVDKELEEIRKELQDAQGQKRTRLIKRLDVLDEAYNYCIKNNIPVIEYVDYCKRYIKPTVK